MIEDARFHERREAEERAIASALPDGEARERHLELADQHANRAWLILSGAMDDHVDGSGNAPRGGTDLSVSQAITRSRQLLAQSRRILAESRQGILARS